MAATSHDYAATMAGQLGFITTFLGGVAATLMGSLLLHKDPRRRVTLAIGFAAGSAIAFILAAFGTTQMIASLSPDAPVKQVTALEAGKIATAAGVGLGFTCLFACIAISGWIRSRTTGLITTTICVLGFPITAWIVFR